MRRSFGFGQDSDSSGGGNILSNALNTLETKAQASAQAQATSYAEQFYQENEAQIWIAGVVLTGWIIWVSWSALEVTRRVKKT
jgi:hypothetical protein